MSRHSLAGKRNYEQLKMIGACIAQNRKAHALTQEKLAARVGISRIHLARLEQGIGAPSLPLLIAISETLEIPLKSLFEI